MVCQYRDNWTIVIVDLTQDVDIILIIIPNYEIIIIAKIKRCRNSRHGIRNLFK